MGGLKLSILFVPQIPAFARGVQNFAGELPVGVQGLLEISAAYLPHRVVAISKSMGG